MKLFLPAVAFAAVLLAPVVPAAAAPARKLIPLLASAKSFSVTETISRLDDQNQMYLAAKALMQFQQGGKYRADVYSYDTDSEEHTLAISDGTHRYRYLPTKSLYRKVSAAGDMTGDIWLPLETVPPGQPIRTMLSGKPALLFQRVVLDNGTPWAVKKTWVDVRTHLLRRTSFGYFTKAKQETVYQVVFSKWKMNPTIPASRFVFVPPAGAKELVAQAPPAEPLLLANGTTAPDFAVQDKDGHPVHLSDYKGKVVVLDFWATWCGPCQASLPHTQSVAAQFAPQGVIVLAVNVWDKHEAFEEWLPKHADFKDIAFAIDPSDGSTAVTKAYNVSGIPTQYVIGKDGKIAQSFVGYDGPTDDLANVITLALKGGQ